MLNPKLIASAMRALRSDSLRLLDGLSDAQLEYAALPRWTVADVFRHLADSDRGSVLGKHLLEFLPGKDLEGEFQEQNDANLSRLRARDRAELRAELDAWGGRMAAIVQRVPDIVGALRIPTGFGKVPIAWMGGLRLYDEWVHQWDVLQALAARGDDLPELGVTPPAMAADLAEVLATWHLLAHEADALHKPLSGALVEVRFDDARDRRQFDQEARRAAVALAPSPDATVTTDVGTWSLLAANRVEVDALLEDGRVKVEGDEAGARSLLATVRVV